MGRKKKEIVEKDNMEVLFDYYIDMEEYLLNKIYELYEADTPPDSPDGHVLAAIFFVETIPTLGFPMVSPEMRQLAEMLVEGCDNYDVGDISGKRLANVIRKWIFDNPLDEEETTEAKDQI